MRCDTPARLLKIVWLWAARRVSCYWKQRSDGIAALLPHAAEAEESSPEDVGSCHTRPTESADEVRQTCAATNAWADRLAHSRNLLKHILVRHTAGFGNSASRRRWVLAAFKQV